MSSSILEIIVLATPSDFPQTQISGANPVSMSIAKHLRNQRPEIVRPTILCYVGTLRIAKGKRLHPRQETHPLALVPAIQGARDLTETLLL